MGDEEQKDVSEVKLGRGATVALVIGLVVVMFILVITVRGCSIQKTVNSGSGGQTSQTTVKEPSTTTSKVPSETTKPSQKDPENQGSVSPPVENPTTPNDSNISGEQSGNNNNLGFSEVADPVLSNQRSGFGMVVGKHIYKKSGSYVYGVSISIIINEQSVMAEYFCPRRTYDELSSGDSLDVTYQVDSNGAVSIYSISRG